MRVGDRQYLHAGSVGGPNAGDRVLDDQTVFGSQTDVSPGGSAVERGQGMEKPFRVRLPASDILRTGDMLELLPDAGLFQNELDLVPKRSGGNREAIPAGGFTDQLPDARKNHQGPADALEVGAGLACRE